MSDTHYAQSLKVSIPFQFLHQHRPIKLFVLTEMSQTCTIQPGGPGHMCLWSNRNVASMFEALDFLNLILS